MTDRSFRQAQEHLAGVQRSLRDAERIMSQEAEKLANSGKLFPVVTRENGRDVTRFHGDIAATFAPFMAGGVRGRVSNPRRGGNR